MINQYELFTFYSAVSTVDFRMYVTTLELALVVLCIVLSYQHYYVLMHGSTCYFIKKGFQTQLSRILSFEIEDLVSSI